MTGDELLLYSDGGCINNPGPGGYGIILEAKTKNLIKSKELYQGFRYTTNNRMELMGVIVGLETIHPKNQRIRIYTDSRYIVDAFEKKWVFQWRKKSFKNRLNKDLWRRLLKIYHQHRVIFHWVKGHHADPRNERCDQLVGLAIKKGPLIIDAGYEKSIM